MVAKSSYSECVSALNPKGRYLMANPRISDILRSVLTSNFSDKTAIFIFAGEKEEELLALKELIEEGKAHPALIVGLPVGFVNAAESKATLMEMDYPYISNIGRKGGSNLAASVVNALTILAGA